MDMKDMVLKHVLVFFKEKETLPSKTEEKISCLTRV
jgi:hypothetical protein